MTQETSITPSPPLPIESTGLISALLLKDGVIDERQLSYATRVRSKLTTHRTMMDTLLDLGYVTQEQLQKTLRSNQMNIRLGDLLLELGYLRETDLQQALGIQKELQGKKRLGRSWLKGASSRSAVCWRPSPTSSVTPSSS